MRTYRQCHDALKRLVLDTLKPDVFVHTWANSGLALPGLESTKDPAAEETITYESLESHYRPKGAVIENFDESYMDELHGIRAPEALKRAEPGHYRTALPMFYKIYSCNAIKSAYEEAEGFKYDLVIRLRPDLMLLEPIPEEILHDTEHLWFSDHSITLDFQVSDKFLVGSSKIMDSFCSIWEMLGEYWKNPLGDGSPHQFRVGERLAFHHARHLNLRTKPFHLACLIERGTVNSSEQEKWRTTLGAAPTNSAVKRP